jgi:ATP-dependent DNA helicase RecQ
MLTNSEYVAAMHQARSGEAKLLYLAPETLVRPETLVLLEESRLVLLTVDEAHCISEWGHDFRPEYRKLREIRARFPDAVCLALTATATPRVQEDIRSQLGIARENSFIAPFDRPNLFLEVARRDNGFAQVRELIERHPGEAGIVYCSTRDQVDTLVTRLNEAGIRALPYHAGLDDRTRRENQRRFLRDDAPVMVATIAFGMGINKPDVRFVVHHNLPDCVETYYQQIGRAGRDGMRSECLLLFARADVGTMMHFVQQGAPNERVGRTMRLQAMVRYAEATGCRRAVLLPYFDDLPPEEACGMCDNCRAEAQGRERVDVSEDARRFILCMQQTRQRFGMGHVIDVLRGSQSARVLKWSHEKLEAHGSGRHRPAEEWRQLGDRFIELGLIEIEMEHGTLRITPAGRKVLEGATVEVFLEARRATGPAAVARPDHDAVLFEILRRRRKELADAQGVPPYVLFADRTLIEMACYYPRSREELLRLHGVGEHKANAYGEPFLELIRAYVEERGVTPVEKPRPEPRAEPASSTRAPAGTRAREMGEAFQSGLGLAELQERFKVVEGTVIQNLSRYQDAGGELDPDRVLAECHLDESSRARVLELLEESGGLLGPVFAALGGEVPYRELHLIRMYRRALQPEPSGEA